MELLWSWWHPFASPHATKSLSEVTGKEGDLTPLPADGLEGRPEFLSSHQGMSIRPSVRPPAALTLLGHAAACSPSRWPLLVGSR